MPVILHGFYLVMNPNPQNPAATGKASRYMYYVQFLWCVSFAQGTKLVKEDRLNICIATILLLAIAFSFWTFFFVIGNVHGTYPYTFR